MSRSFATVYRPIVFLCRPWPRYLAFAGFAIAAWTGFVFLPGSGVFVISALIASRFFWGPVRWPRPAPWIQATAMWLIVLEILGLGGVPFSMEKGQTWAFLRSPWFFGAGAVLLLVVGARGIFCHPDVPPPYQPFRP